MTYQRCRFQSILRDVTDRRKIEHEREKYRSNLEAIFSSVKDALITVDSEMRVIEANKATEDICGLPAQEIIGTVSTANSKTYRHMFLHSQVYSSKQPCFDSTNFGIYFMEKSIIIALDKLRSVIENQLRRHFCRTCRQMRTLLEVSLLIMADTLREYSTAGCTVGVFKHIMQLSSTLSHAFAVMVRLFFSYKQTASQNCAA